MNAPAPNLPADAILALRKGQKNRAIDIVRQQHGLAQAAAVAVVETAIGADPYLRRQCQAASRFGSGSGWRIFTWVLAIVASIIAWVKFGWQF
ncbi:MAG: hypothetical protein JSR26_12695 [Proteobacteria bacterium]|nr:hypothetical protein [Pseudomonadota bacterium]